MKYPFYQIEIYIVESLPETPKGNKYIEMVIDYVIKWPEDKALREANARKVFTFIYKEIIGQHKCTQKNIYIYIIR